jgi:hypothetical protein
VRCAVQKIHLNSTLASAWASGGAWAQPDSIPEGMLSVLYSVIRLLVDIVTTMRRDQAELAAEVLTLRRQVQVLERQIKRVHWTPGDRMVMAVLARLLPKSAWKGVGFKKDVTRPPARAGTRSVGHRAEPSG